MKVWKYFGRDMSVGTCLIVAGACLVLGGVGGWLGVPWISGLLTSEHKPEVKDAKKDDVPSRVTFAKGKWEAAGLKMEQAVYAPFTRSAWRTGKVKLNENRVTHIAPLFEGIVREIHGNLGADVKPNEVLAVLESKEVGQAKLELTKNRLALGAAQSQAEWTKAVVANTEELLKALEDHVTQDVIEQRFRGKLLGERRQQLLAAYSKKTLAQLEYQRQDKLRAIGTAPQSAYQSAKSEWETAAATYQSMLEETRFQNSQQLKASEQRLREAQTQVALGGVQLLMMGFRKEEADKADALTEGARASYFPIRAPIAGTILARDLSFGERVSPTNVLFEIADLSQLWIQADVPEVDLPYAGGLVGKKIVFKTASCDDPCEAEVFFLGDRLDKTTRTFPLLAQTANPQRRLKPGMFVEVQLSHTHTSPLLQVPATALQRVGLQNYLFVQIGDDEFERVEVTLGRSTADRIEIVSGLQPGQTVVIEGAFALKSELLRSTLKAE